MRQVKKQVKKQVKQQSNRQDKIIKIFKAHGCGMSVLRLSQKCEAEGVFDEVDLNNAKSSYMQRAVCDALKAKMDGDIPFAAPTAKTDEDGGKKWIQRDLWDYEDFEYIVMGRCQGIAYDYRVLVAIREFGLEKWGKAPEILQLVLK